MKTMLIGALALLAVCGGVLADETPEPANFTLLNLAGDETSLSDYRGQWVVVNYWAIWCKPCVKEIPDLSALHRRHENLTVLGIAFDESEPADISTFLEDFDVSYPILLVDTFEPAEGVETPMVLPTTVLFDANGLERKRFLGAVTGEQIESAIETLANGDDGDA